LFSIKYYKFLYNNCCKLSTTGTLYTAEIAKTSNIQPVAVKHPNMMVNNFSLKLEISNKTIIEPTFKHITTT